MTSMQIVHGDDEAFELIRSHKHYKLSSRLIDFALTLSGLDPFAGTRCARKNTARWNGWMREYWSRWSMYVAVYLSVKVLIIALLRSTLKGMKNEQNKNLIGKLDWTKSLIGDPLSSLALPRLIFDIFVPSLTLWTKFYQPIYLDRVGSYDCAFSRFTLEPKEEIRRFDLQASSITKDTVRAVELQRWRIAYNLRKELNFNEEWEAIYTSLSDIQRQIIQLRKSPLIRPKTLSAKRLESTYKIFACSTLCVILVNVICCVAATVYFAWIAWIGRCYESSTLETLKHAHSKVTIGWPTCRLLEAFSCPDLLVIAEITTLFPLLAIVPSTMLIILQPQQVARHLCLTMDILRSQRKLLDGLHKCNPESQPGIEQRGLSDQLVCELYTNIVSLWMFERETRKCVSMLSHGTRCAIVEFISFAVVMFGSMRLHSSHGRENYIPGPDSSADISSVVDLNLAVMGLLALWVSAAVQMNVMLVSCAIIPSMITVMNRLEHSLLAQLVRIQHSSRSPNDLERLNQHDYLYPADDPITSLWRRRVESKGRNADWSAVCVFNTRLTYGRVLAIQYYTATIISLLYSFI